MGCKSVIRGFESHLGLLSSRASRVRLAVLIVAIGLAVAGFIIWGFNDTPKDDRIELVFWGHPTLGDDIYTLVHEFEAKNPQYKVIMGTAVAQDVTGDAQRLLSAINGGVPPDVVWFDRFAIGEWAGRSALTDLTPYLEKQDPNDPNRIDVSQYYPWSLEEASYRPPGSNEKSRVYGIPTEADVRLLYANADVLRQAGYIDGNGKVMLPKNWDELRRYATR